DDAPPAEVGGPAARKLLLASAGPGKTYALAGQFATLLVLGVPPERVLATTFTRKAAGEILDRVLARVADAAEESEAGEEARAQIREIAEDLVPGGAEIVTTAHCRGVLARLLRSIGRFQVRTLDAFFVRLASLFGDQLEIAPGWRITSEVEEKALTLEAIARLLEVAEDDEQLELLRGIARGGAERGAAASMASVVEDADELARQAVDGAWGRIAPLERPADVALSEAIRAVLDFQVPTTSKGKPDSRWAKVHQTLKDILEDFDLDLDRAALEEAMGKGFAVKALDPVPEYYKAPLPDDLVDALLILHQLLASVRVEDLRERNAATGRLLTGYHSAERALRTELSAWRFSDFQGALLDGPARGERATWLRDVTFRLDGRIDHLLLDEFQDTAPGQWRLLLPLAEEILAGGDELRTFFCVGDVKQSIYGWRGGEPRLL
ncbi:MAG: UvrD-helicase domain-containing protein, partial [Planctomycetota bacterium]|nr:UvrD-helicase domain-containing protein [Planctomycetota bacterium]